MPLDMNDEAPLITEVLPLGDLLVRSAYREPDREALVFPDRRLTYREFADQAMQISRGLAALGIRPGDHVGLLIPNSPELISAFFGIAMMGAVIVPINTRYKVAELRFTAQHADLVAIVTTSAGQDYVDLPSLLRVALGPELAHAPALRHVVNLGDPAGSGAMDRDEFFALADSVSEAQIEHWRWAVRLRQPAILLYTSGTTARAKGCILTHESLARKYALVGRWFEVTPNDRCWVPLPLFHGVGIGAMLLTVEAGATFMSSAYFDPHEALEMIQRERATFLYPGFPALSGRLLDAGFEHADLRSVRAVVNAGPPDLWHRLQAAVPHAIQVKGYGLSEAGGIVSYGSMRDTLEVRARTGGSVLPGYEVRIVDPDTRERLPAGQEGEILVSGFGVFEGYYKDPEATRAVLDEDGYLHTGDVGHLDDDGYLVFAAREKDMLKVGGENVAPAEIESFLSSHPLIAQVQVVGAPDSSLGEVPAAFVELRPGAALTEQEVIDYCAGAIARFKVPRLVRFVTAWPMTDSAIKVQKAHLKDQLARELSAQKAGR